MKFPKDTLISKEFPMGEGSIKIQEYELLTKPSKFSIDGALAFFNGSSGTKTNGFDELIFVIEGEIKITEEDKQYTLKKDEMAIIEKGVKHCITGYNNAKTFIVCNPPFNNATSYEEME
ncbi:MAG: cupin domain-containing protein [Alphaproteobacteria bacterium]|jgi:mannose-6-phosphate isomerase-like protein (cupin superfamily)|nr:cupin domain-containing protein [Alphaproteobacteria bacterium]